MVKRFYPKSIACALVFSLLTLGFCCFEMGVSASHECCPDSQPTHQSSGADSEDPTPFCGMVAMDHTRALGSSIDTSNVSTTPETLTLAGPVPVLSIEALLCATGSSQKPAWKALTFIQDQSDRYLDLQRLQVDHFVA